MKQCYVCGTTQNIHKHHCFYGSANRKISEKHGFVEYLCMEHHTGNEGVHFNKKLDLELKTKWQRIYLESHSMDEWMRLIGKNYI
jgi:hypothetical protein